MSVSERYVKRKSNIELLRIIAMCMIISYHYVIHSGFSLNEISLENKIFLEFFSYWGKAGVNIFCIIMGYFGVKSTFSKEKVVRTEAQVLFYSLLGLFVGLTTNFTPITYKSIVMSFLPICFNHYWFVTAYIITYLFSPVFNYVILTFKQDALVKVLISLFIVWCIIPFFTLRETTGMFFTQLNWFFAMYICGGYLYLYKPDLAIKKYILLVSVCVLLQIFVIILFNLIGAKYPIFLRYSSYFRWSNSPIIIVFSIAFFMWLLKADIGYSPVINTLAKGILSIYLFQENLFLRPLIWMKIIAGANILKQDKFFPIALNAMLGVLFVFCIGTILDFIWRLIDNKIRFLYPQIDCFLNKIINNIIKIACK